MITMITTYLICLIGFLCCQQNNSWHGIVPLRSTREEVEKILGPSSPESKGNDAAYYKTEKERVFVLYSNGPCDVQPSNGWDVPHDTVIQVSVDPKFKPKFAELNLDKKRFAKRPDPEVLDYTYYTDDEEGVSIEVNTTDGVVTAFRYSPSSRDKSLRCSPSSEKSPK